MSIKFSLTEEDGCMSGYLHRRTDLTTIPLDAQACLGDGVGELLRLDEQITSEEPMAVLILILVEEAVTLLLLGKCIVKSPGEHMRVVEILAVFVLTGMVPGQEPIAILAIVLIEGFLGVVVVRGGGSLDSNRRHGDDMR